MTKSAILVALLVALPITAHAKPRTAWQAVLDDYIASGFVERNVMGLHIWSSKTGTGNGVLWTDQDNEGYNCGPRGNDGFARCEEYNLATGRFVRIRSIHWDFDY
jgi:hypothetical protein